MKILVKYFCVFSLLFLLAFASESQTDEIDQCDFEDVGFHIIQGFVLSFLIMEIKSEKLFHDSGKMLQFLFT
jgi:hypothetical protein